MIFKEINLFEDTDKKLAEMKQMENDFNLFKERKIKAKDIFTIKEISKKENPKSKHKNTFSKINYKTKH